MKSRPEIQRPIRWLMIIRVVVATTLLVSSLVIELIFRPAVALRPFFVLTGLTYLLTLAYALAYVRFKASAGFAYVQIMGDLLLTTGIVYITGGVESAFSFLYILSILTASIILYRRGALLTASVSWIAYAGLVLLLYHDVLPRFPATLPVTYVVSETRVTYALFAHLLGFLAVGYLGSALTLKLKATGQELEERREDLADLQALHRDILESVLAGIVTTDPEGRITYINPAAERITHRTLASSLGRTATEFFGEPQGLQERVGLARPGGGPQRFEMLCRDAAGEKIHLGTAVSILRDRDGGPRGYVLIFQDLTEIKAMEQELRLKDRMSALGRMAAGMAHELRNPLASMFGSIQILRNELPLNGEQAELMKVVLDESQRLDRTIGEFLHFARPGKFDPRAGDLARVLSDALVLLRNSTEVLPGHRIVTEIDPPAIPYVFDANQMKQIFWNLARNALKAMPSGGSLTVRIEGGERGRGPVIVFADEGIGMEPGEVQRFFQPFETAFPEGTGLGLAIVYRNVQEHGGRVVVQSQPGAGTRFTIHLPPEPAQARVVA